MRKRVLLISLLLLLLMFTIGCGDEHSAKKAMVELEEEIVDQPEVAPEDPVEVPEVVELMPEPKKCKKRRPKWRKKYRCKKMNKGKWIICKKKLGEDDD